MQFQANEEIVKDAGFENQEVLGEFNRAVSVEWCGQKEVRFPKDNEVCTEKGKHSLPFPEFDPENVDELENRPYCFAKETVEHYFWKRGRSLAT